MNINEALKEIKETLSRNLTVLSLDSIHDNSKLNQEDLINLVPELVKLQNLKYLSFYDNKISEIPKEISQLKNLQSVNFEKNEISDLPKEMLELKKLRSLDLKGNKGLEEKIPGEILGDSTNPQKILNYYFKVKEGITRPINEAKIVVIGEANVGKTSLINRLILNKILLTDSTHGIEIRQWKNVQINDEFVRLNVWDFGGQELMHSTHQFFFTNRTIYILVVNARENEDNNKVEEWLKRVESFGGNSPVIIVGNKIDENDRSTSPTEIGYFDINRKTLRDKYENIKGFYEVCADTKKVTHPIKTQKYNKLFDDFRNGLLTEISKFKELHKPFPTNWYSIKEKLEEMQEKDVPYISYNEYIANCVEKDVRDEISQSTIVEFLNEIGTVIFFKDLPDTMVFNPEWITKGVYAIIDNPSIVRNKGELEVEQLNEILNQEEYASNKHKYILNIMRKFELCVDIEPENTFLIERKYELHAHLEPERKFLIPDLLPLDEVYTGEWENALCFQYHYETYLKNIFTKFVVRMFPYIHKKTYWRNGVVLELGGSKALVKADAQEKTLTIQIQGNNIKKRQSLLVIIRNEFNHIHSSFTFRKPAEFVAHPSLMVKDIDGKEKPLLKDYEELVEMEAAGLKNVFAKELKISLPISDWLDGISSKEERHKTKETEEFEGEADYFNKEDFQTKRRAALISLKQNEISELREEIQERKEAIEKYDEEAKKKANVYSRIFLLILLTIIGTSLYFVFASNDSNMKVLLSVISIVILGVTYILSVFKLQEWSPAKFPEQILAKEKERLYAKFDIDIDVLDYKKTKLKDLEYELKRLAR